MLYQVMLFKTALVSTYLISDRMLPDTGFYDNQVCISNFWGNQSGYSHKKALYFNQLTLKLKDCMFVSWKLLQALFVMFTWNAW